MTDNLTLDCSSSQSGDLYGLGVRIGIYCVWLTSWLANNYVPAEIGGALDANAIFLLALIATLVKGTVAHGDNQLRYIDGLILMHLCSGYIFGCFSTWGYRTVWYAKDGRTGIRHAGGFGTHCRLALCTTISIYGCWFWSTGVGTGLAWIMNDDGSKRTECYPLVTFFFGKLPVMETRGIRIWYILITVCTSIYFGLMLLVAFAWRFMAVWETKNLLCRGKGIFLTGFTDKELHLIFHFCRWGNLAWLIFVVIMVEMTLNWNHVNQVVGVNDNIATPGQLLPLLIGAMGLVRILYIMSKDKPAEERVKMNNGVEANPDLQQTKETDFDIMSRTIAVRYLVAWLPWLSTMPMWTKHGIRQSGHDVELHTRQHTNEPEQGKGTRPQFTSLSDAGDAAKRNSTSVSVQSLTSSK